MSTEPTASGDPEPAGRRRRRWRRWLSIGAVGLVVLFGVIQAVPFGRGGNPPVTKAAAWPSTQAQALAESGCYDCHSNLTERWWATRIAPVSWLAQNDVSGGREHLNFSEWDTPQAALDEVVRAVRSGSMPPIQYKVVHGDARLSDAERRQLIDGLEQLYAADPPAGTTHGGG